MAPGCESRFGRFPSLTRLVLEDLGFNCNPAGEALERLTSLISLELRNVILPEGRALQGLTFDRFIGSAAGLAALTQLPALADLRLQYIGETHHLIRHDSPELDMSPLRHASGLTWLNMCRFRVFNESEVRPSSGRCCHARQHRSSRTAASVFCAKIADTYVCNCNCAWAPGRPASCVEYAAAGVVVADWQLAGSSVICFCVIRSLMCGPPMKGFGAVIQAAAAARALHHHR